MNAQIQLDRGARVLEGGRLILGGDPPRAVRLSPAGARALDGLQGEQPPVGAAAGALAERLIEAGIAHPCPVRVPRPDVTVIVPVRDRASELERCLAATDCERVIVVDDGSRDELAVARVCQRHGAELIRRELSGGPAAARNAGLARVESELVAFLDSDCVPDSGWLELLAGAVSGAGVGAAAPRIQPLALTGTSPNTDTMSGCEAGPASRAVARYAAVRSPLDLGDRPGEVRPGSRIAYVPTAALLVRRVALGSGFDEALRYGEDVDLVWRLHDAGWRIRYEPTAVVRHSEPESWRSLTARRFRYGTAAGPLARRHPERLAPVVIHPRPGAAVALAVAGQPGPAVIAAALHLGVSVRRLRHVGVPASVAASIGTQGLIDSAAAVGQAGTMLSPGLMVAGLLRRRSRSPALALIAAKPLRDWTRLAPDLDPVRFTALSLADDVAYGAGVWAGAIRARTWRPLWPAFRRHKRAVMPVSAKINREPSAGMSTAKVHAGA